MFRTVYPLAALVGQETLIRCLLLNAVNPGVGGVLIRGEKGTAKSTAVRALASLLPEILVVRGCAFSCNPERIEGLCSGCRETASRKTDRRKVRIVNLPLNATEDRVAGGIDFSPAIKNGRRALSSGLLAAAHRGILYVDEINLLDDHIVDIILDAAASGYNRVEREGISFGHPARFILIGTMNPEEGELRPQLLDRFGLCVEVTGAQTSEERVRLMKRRDEFDGDPQGFCQRFQSQSETIARQITEGRKILPRVRTPDHLRGFMANLCMENHVAGHRADLVLEQAARALAALLGETAVTVEHISQVAPLVLAHRSRDEQTPPPPPSPPDDEPEEDDPRREEPENENNHQPRSQNNQPRTEEQNGPSPEETPPEGRESSPAPNEEDRNFLIGDTFKVKRISSSKDRLVRRGSGRRSRTRIAQKQGRYVKSSLENKSGDIALDATLRAAAPCQKNRRGKSDLAVHLTASDIREKVREKRVGNFILFTVDASGSMGARGRMAASKGAVMSLLLDAYQKRDRVAMISFRRNDASVNLPPTPSVELAGKLLSEMAVGGRTPLSAGLSKSFEVTRNYLLKEPTARPIVIIITDGKSNVSLGERKPLDESRALAAAMARDERVKYVVVDTEEDGIVSFGLAKQLAAALGADYFKIDDLKAEELVTIAKGEK